MVQLINYGMYYQISQSAYKSNTDSLHILTQNESSNFSGYPHNPISMVSASKIEKIDDLPDFSRLFLNFIKKINKFLGIYHCRKKMTPGTRESARNKIIEEERKHLSQLTRERTEYNTRQLKSAGVKDADVKKYLKTDGHVTEEGKRLLREKGKSYK